MYMLVLATPIRSKNQLKTLPRYSAFTWFVLRFCICTAIGFVLQAHGSDAISEKDTARAGGVAIFLTNNARSISNLEGIAQTNSAAQWALVAADFLRQEQKAVSNYYSATLPLLKMRLLNMADVKSREDLESRRAMAERFISANGELSKFYSNAETNFQATMRQMSLTKDIIKERADWLHTNMNRISEVSAIYSLNENWGQCELKAINFLISKWTGWHYNSSLRKTIFKSDTDADQFNLIVQEINKVDRERKLIRDKLEEKLQSKPIK